MDRSSISIPTKVSLCHPSNRVDQGHGITVAMSRDWRKGPCTLGSNFGRWELTGEFDLATRSAAFALRANQVLDFVRFRLSGAQRGISGNKACGCDAIIVSDKNRDKINASKNASDEFRRFVYTAPSAVGGLAIHTSARAGKPIRVFRSSSCRLFPARTDGNKKYRYDGLYQVATVGHYEDSHEMIEAAGEHLSIGMKGREYNFTMVRVEKGASIVQNKLGDREIVAIFKEAKTLAAVSPRTAADHSLRDRRRAGATEWDGRFRGFKLRAVLESNYLAGT